MSNNTFFLPKEDQDLPNNYSAKITYRNGSKEEVSIAEHTWHKNPSFINSNETVPYVYFWQQGGMLEIITEEDTVKWIFLDTVQSIEFDKRFSKLLEIKQKKDKENEK